MFPMNFRLTYGGRYFSIINLSGSYAYHTSNRRKKSVVVFEFYVHARKDKFKQWLEWDNLDEDKYLPYLCCYNDSIIYKFYDLKMHAYISTDQELYITTLIDCEKGFRYADRYGNPIVTPLLSHNSRFRNARAFAIEEILL